jgi:uncharacterized protein with HEPN domain
MRDDRERLLDIQEAIAAIERHPIKSRDASEVDELLQIWVIHHLQVIGEAVRALSENLREKNPQVDWSGIMGARNVLIHHYFGIDWDVIWGVVQSDLPALKKQIDAILRDWPSEENAS